MLTELRIQNFAIIDHLELDRRGQVDHHGRP
jgi:DNA repair ATPase RecN